MKNGLHPAQIQHQQKSKPIGLWTATALVIGAMLGGGIFSLPRLIGQFRYN